MKTALTLFLIFIFHLVIAQRKIPQVSLDGRPGGKISRMDFIDSKKLVIRVGDDDSTWKVTDYKISFQKEANEIMDFDVKGEMKPSKLDTIMMLLPPGTKIYFEFIRARMINGSDKSLYAISPITFVLTE
jgi:hypothetical protein